MNDPFAVGGLQCFGNLLAEVQRRLDRERPLGKPLFQRLAFHQLQYEEACPLVFFESVDRGDVGVAERRQQVGPPAPALRGDPGRRSVARAAP